MDVHRQTCQACGSRRHHNIIARPAGRPTEVFVRCTKCGELVAYYELTRYYHHGKGAESYLRSVGPGLRESGRNVLDDFERMRNEVLEWYPKALEALKEQGKPL